MEVSSLLPFPREEVESSLVRAGLIPALQTVQRNFVGHTKLQSYALALLLHVADGALMMHYQLPRLFVWSLSAHANCDVYLSCALNALSVRAQEDIYLCFALVRN